MCCNYENECRVTDCRYTETGEHSFSYCGLYCFLNTIDEELQNFHGEEELINTLRNDYLGAWNKNPNSRGKGKATGSAFERWIKNQIGKYKGGKVDFNGFKFNVDIVIPTSSNPKVILEVKILADLQHTLTFGGLLDFSKEKQMKLGIVTFYRPSAECIKILEHFKEKESKRFAYFSIQNGWSETIQNLKEFCNQHS